MSFLLRITLLSLTIRIGAWAQSTPTLPASPPPYPRVAGYFSVIHPLLTVDANGIAGNFGPVYTVGFPTGLNILKSDHIGFSFEITPFIRAENGNSRVYNLLFHPGVMFRFPRRFTINQRLAFETSGRYGTTTVFSKVVKYGPSSALFVAVPLPLRLGADRATSVGVGLQVGVSF